MEVITMNNAEALAEIRKGIQEEIDKTAGNSFFGHVQLGRNALPGFRQKTLQMIQWLKALVN